MRMKPDAWLISLARSFCITGSASFPLRLIERPCVEKHHLNQSFHLHSSLANRRVSNSNLRVPLALHQKAGPPHVDDKKRRHYNHYSTVKATTLSIKSAKFLLIFFCRGPLVTMACIRLRSILGQFDTSLL